MKQIQFSLLDPDELRRASPCEVRYAETLDESGQPREGGLVDPRMGPASNTARCRTCGGTSRDCPGHFGRIELHRPIVNVCAVDILVKILQCVCFSCGRLLLPVTDHRYEKIRQLTEGKERFRQTVAACKGKSHFKASVRKTSALDRADTASDTENDSSATECHSTEKRRRVAPSESKAVRRRSRKCKSKRAQNKDGMEHKAGTETATGTTTDEEERDVGEEVQDVVSCSAVQPIISCDHLRFYAHYDKDVKIPVTPEEIFELLSRISDTDAYMLGFQPPFGHPKWLMWTVLPVLPPCARPSGSSNGSARSERELTSRYADIITTNQQLRLARAEKKPANVQDDLYTLLATHVASIIDSSIMGQYANTTSQRKSSSIIRRLEGKHGRIRGNLMGKRVDFSARTVITPDPHLSVQEVGVPRAVAQTLTYPVAVTPLNIETLRDAVRAGPRQLDGAKFIIRTDGTRIDLRYTTHPDDLRLQVGYKVERHLRDGDIVVFNRQPSLHKMSLMGHRVKIMPWSSFRLNLSATTPYNADFDGDEMNLHVPQTEEARAEIESLMMVPRLIVSPQSNKPVIGVVQDALLGASKLSARDCFLKRHHVHNLMMCLPSHYSVPRPCILKPEPLWSGKQLLSLLFPDTLRYQRNNNQSVHDRNSEDGRQRAEIDFPAADWRVLIRQGQLLTGSLDKSVLGSSGGSLIHVMWLEYGPERTALLIDSIQRVVNTWLIYHGFSIGIGDAVPDEQTQETVRQIIERAQTSVGDLNRALVEGKLRATPGRTLRDTLENQVNTALNAARDASGKAAEKSLGPQNNLKQMVVAGSKGSFINIAQMIACVGQQNVEGQRIPCGFRDRTLPHFEPGDNGSVARGFVEHSYLAGLAPHEFFFHAMGGREGLIDTAIKTSEVGYIQRRLIKAMEDVMVRYDGTVRNSQNDIVQFAYGDDHFDATYMEQHHLPYLRYSIDELMDKFRHPSVLESRSHTLRKEWQCLRQVWERVQPLYADGDQRVVLPVHLGRIIESVLTCGTAVEMSDPKAHPNQMAAHVLQWLDGLLKQPESRRPTLQFELYLRAGLCSKILREAGVHTLHQLETILKQVERGYYQALIASGEAVGLLAAQSIGEPTTQMTLNSLDWEELILIRVGGDSNDAVLVQPIGQLIDECFAAMEASRVTLLDHGETRYATVQDKHWSIPSVDDGGHIHWKRITAITRHLPQNADGTDTLLRVTTASGRSVVATKAKSFLIWNDDNTLQPCNGSDLQIGHQIPVTSHLYVPPSDTCKRLDLAALLTAHQHPSLAAEFTCLGERRWLSLERELDFALLLGVFVASHSASSTAPLSSGKRADGKMIILRVLDEQCAHRITKWCQSWDCSFERVVKHSPATTEYVITISSDILCSLVWSCCGHQVSGQVGVPLFAVTAPIDFVRHFLRGWFASSDAVAIHDSYTLVPCASGPLLADGLCALLSRLRIITKRSTIHTLPSEQQSQQPATHLTEQVWVQDSESLQRLEQLISWGDDWMQESVEETEDKGMTGGTYRDTIVYIAPVQPTHRYVYDFTVEDTLNFATWSGVHVRDTFHYAGVSAKNNTLGLPRLKELINVGKHIKTPSLHIALHAPYSGDESRAQLVKQAIETVYLAQVTNCTEIYYDPDPLFTVVEEDVHMLRSLYNAQSPPPVARWLLRMVLSPTRLTEYNLSITQVANRIKQAFGPALHLEYSHDPIARPVIRIRIASATMGVQTASEKLSAASSQARKRREKSRTAHFDLVDETWMRCLQQYLLDKLVLKGVHPHIRKVYVQAPNHHQKEWHLETDGSQLQDVMHVTGVDYRRTISNDILEVCNVLGIEGARSVLLDELRKVIEFDGAYVNYRHINLLADTMTHRGFLMPITRHGMNRVSTGPLMKSSFEETVDILSEAAIFAQRDNLQGPTGPIMLGQLCPMGTGHFTIVPSNDHYATPPGAMTQEEICLRDPSAYYRNRNYIAQAAATKPSLSLPTDLTAFPSFSFIPTEPEPEPEPVPVPVTEHPWHMYSSTDLATPAAPVLDSHLLIQRLESMQQEWLQRPYQPIHWDGDE